LTAEPPCRRVPWVPIWHLGPLTFPPQFRDGEWTSGEIQSVEGAGLNFGVENPTALKEKLWIQIPASDSEEYPRVKIVIHFSTGQKKGKPEKH
jgi:hypothetical protein